MEICPSCKKKHKNLILHIKKSTKCKDNVSEEEMKTLEDQSKNRRRQYKKKTMMERRRKVKSENSKERKQDTEHKQDMTDTEDNEFPKMCPICKTKKNNILLHIKTKKSCFMKIDKQDYEKWSKMARLNTQKAQNRKLLQNYHLNKLYNDTDTYNDKEKDKKESTSENKILTNSGNSKDYETLSESQKSFMTHQKIMTELKKKESQNRRKAKSREKARQNNHDAVKKYQREATSKWRTKQKKEDPELYKARQLMWKLQERPVTSHNLMRVPKKGKSIVQ